MKRARVVLALALGVGFAARAGAAQQPVDRVAIRFSAPELGGARSARYITERQLAFEARLEALADPERPRDAPEAYRRQHVRAAIERHVTEVLLASARLEPAPSPAELREHQRRTRQYLEARAGSAEALAAAAAAEGLGPAELQRWLLRVARASLYLERMVAPLVAPTNAELTLLYRSGAHPFKELALPEARPLLRRWVTARRLAQALGSYYQSARTRVSVSRAESTAPPHRAPSAVTRRAP